MTRTLLLCLLPLLAAPALANGTDTDGQATAPVPATETRAEPEIDECDVCTARHKSLQRLQQKRLSLPDEEAQANDDG